MTAPHTQVNLGSFIALGSLESEIVRTLVLKWLYWGFETRSMCDVLLSKKESLLTSLAIGRQAYRHCDIFL